MGGRRREGMGGRRRRSSFTTSCSSQEPHMLVRRCLKQIHSRRQEFFVHLHQASQREGGRGGSSGRRDKVKQQAEKREELRRLREGMRQGNSSRRHLASGTGAFGRSQLTSLMPRAGAVSCGSSLLPSSHLSRLKSPRPVACTYVTLIFVLFLLPSRWLAAPPRELVWRPH